MISTTMIAMLTVMTSIAQLYFSAVLIMKEVYSCAYVPMTFQW